MRKQSHQLHSHGQTPNALDMQKPHKQTSKMSEEHPTEDYIRNFTTRDVDQQLSGGNVDDKYKAYHSQWHEY